MSGAEDLDGDLPERRDPADAIVRVLEIVNKKGLHARAPPNSARPSSASMPRSG